MRRMKEGQELWPSVQRGGLNESRETQRRSDGDLPHDCQLWGGDV